MINKSMNYKKHYDLLIERSKNRNISGYTEKHHIVPKCLGGTDDSSNIAVLTPEEHYLAHLLLVKMYPKSTPLVNAAVIMTTHHTDKRVNNKLYGWLRKKASEAAKERIKKNGHPKGMAGKQHTAESNARRAEACRAAMVEARGVQVYTYQLNGKFDKKFETITDCAKHLGTSPSNVKYAAEGKFGHCKGRMIRYELWESITPYIKPSPLKGRVITEEHRNNISKAKKGKKMPDGWAQAHSEKMKLYHKRKKEKLK